MYVHLVCSGCAVRGPRSVIGALTLPAYTKSWLDRTNKRLFTVVGFNLERFLVSVFHASNKFDSNLELDAGMHKTKRAMHHMMGNVGAPFSSHHKRILDLVVVSRFTGNAKLTAA